MVKQRRRSAETAARPRRSQKAMTRRSTRGRKARRLGHLHLQSVEASAVKEGRKANDFSDGPALPDELFGPQTSAVELDRHDNAEWPALLTT